jgi:protein ImuA
MWTVTRQVISRQTIAELQTAIRRCERKPVHTRDGVVSTGCGAVDELLPAGGIRRGSLVEWLGTEPAGGAVTLSLAVGRTVTPPERPMVLIDRRRELFPLALEAMGIDLARLVLIHPRTERDALWVCEESLRCPGVGLVWMQADRLSGTSFRRLQLAAEAGGTVGFLVRPEIAVQQPSWAEARLQVRPIASRGASLRYRIEMADSQGWPRRSGSEVLIDNVQGTIHDDSSFRPADPLSVVS